MLRRFSDTCDAIVLSKDGYRVFNERHCNRKPIWKVIYKIFSHGKYSETIEKKMCTQHFNELKKAERISIVSAEKI